VQEVIENGSNACRSLPMIDVGEIRRLADCGPDVLHDRNSCTWWWGNVTAGKSLESIESFQLQHRIRQILTGFQSSFTFMLNSKLAMKWSLTRNILDCDQYNYSSRIIFSCIPPKLLCIHERGSDNSFQRYGHSNFSKMAGGRILDLVQPEVGPFDPQTSKTLPLEPNMKWIGW